MSRLGLLGSLGVDATTGEVLYQAPGTGFLTAAGPIVAFGYVAQLPNQTRLQLRTLTQFITTRFRRARLRLWTMGRGRT